MIVLQSVQRLLIRDVVSLAVRDRKSKHGTCRDRRGERSIAVLDAHADVPTDEAEPGVSHEGSREQTNFGQDLEAVANPKDEATFACVSLDRLHDRSELGQCPCAKVIAVSESAGEDYAIDVPEVPVLVPEGHHFGAEDFLCHVKCVVIAVGSGQNHDAKFHGAFLIGFAEARW